LDGLFSGRVAVVTGAARGIGRAIVARLLADGASVIAADIRDAGSWDFVPAGQVVALQADVTDPEAVQGVMSEALDRFGRLDMAVCNAGVASSRPFLDMGLDDWRRVLSINLDGTFICSQAAARVMSAQGGGGSIVLIGSVHGEMTFPTNSAYDVAKAGVMMLGEAAACELAPHGIRVNVVGPGFIETAMNQEFLARPGRRAEAESMIPMGRLGRPDDVADVVAFLLSDAARYITGSYLRCDGGYILSKDPPEGRA
jgi:NAD(P)-dependent dehydrogenase (short-subunit alcohol dehydrogenase family)